MLLLLINRCIIHCYFLITGAELVIGVVLVIVGRTTGAGVLLYGVGPGLFLVGSK